MLRAIFCFGIFFGFVNASADNPKRLTIKPKTDITIKSYLKDSDVYVVVSLREPESDPNYVTPDALKNAIGFKGDMDEFRRKISIDNSTVYFLKKSLPLLWDTELESRKKLVRKR